LAHHVPSPPRKNTSGNTIRLDPVSAERILTVRGS
jgi:hypothetical protein